ncbi:hypothetical protein C9374_006301 [Naegleria lovaniensis]|uniref:Uncharacterized protein n=1 Tax=Naegleria lovaniensis TaxID=51637 RepID=A0AA88GMU7_NAELO|nr:uncharacterized protein C9374_006301 [Naegleria lovaniensis]KAG2381312.1 hypothetical protein C9374_006301 [Naegleria lovaniensis]
MGQTTSADVFTSRSAGVLNIIPENVWERQIHMRNTNVKVNTNPEEYSIVLKDGKLKDPNNHSSTTTKRTTKRKKRRPRPPPANTTVASTEGRASTVARNTLPIQGSSEEARSSSLLNNTSNNYGLNQVPKVKPLPRRAKTISSSSSSAREVIRNEAVTDFPNENDEETFDQLIEATYQETLNKSQPQQQPSRGNKRPPLPHPVLYSPSQNPQPVRPQSSTTEISNTQQEAENTEDSVTLRTPHEANRHDIFSKTNKNSHQYEDQDVEASSHRATSQPGIRSFAPSAMTKDSTNARKIFGVGQALHEEEDDDEEAADIDDENIDEENDDEVDEENAHTTVSSPRSGELTGTPRNRSQDATSSQPGNESEQPTSKVVIIDFGHQTTKVGFSHEDRPRVVIPSCYNIEEDPRNNNQKTIKFGGTISLQQTIWFFKNGKFTFSRHDEQGREIFVAFVRYIAKVLLGLQDAFKGKTVMIALPYIFGEDKDQMVMLCETFFHPSIQAKSLFLCGTPLFSFISAAANHITDNRSTALSVTVGHGISQVIPIVDGCPFSTCGVSSVVGGALQGEYLVTLIKKEVEREGVTLDDSLITYESVEKEKITNCSLVKSFRLNKKRPNECKAKFFKKTMNPVKGVIEHVLDHRCLCPELLFTPRLYEKGRPIVRRISDALSANADSAQLSSTEEPPVSAQNGSSTTSNKDEEDPYLGVVALIENCLKKCPKEFHELLLSNVVVSGGPSQIRNFVEEDAPPFDFSVWYGMSFLSTSIDIDGRELEGLHCRVLLEEARMEHYTLDDVIISRSYVSYC